MSTAARWHSGVSTDAGPTRTNNEDRVYADDANGIFLVIDGLGGHAAGEKAAEVALGVINRELGEETADPERRARRAITAANNEIFRLAEQQPEWRGMACVLTLVLLNGDRLTAAHVGDSRLYLLWSGTLRKLTSDHSPVGELEDLGQLTETEAMQHPRRHEVFRDVGSRLREPDEPDFVEIRSLPFHPAAALLLCTDGLTDVLTATEIGEVINAYDGDPASVAASLVKAANERGGFDNVSVVFVPGPDFAPVPRDGAAHARHAITRMRPPKPWWRTHGSQIVWLLVGVVLGMMLWWVVELVRGAGRLC